MHYFRKWSKPRAFNVLGGKLLRQLGVGDTNPRSTPTAVTATVLGDAGGGTPKTVKSVALGYRIPALS